MGSEPSGSQSAALSEARDLTVEVDGQSYSVRVIAAVGSLSGDPTAAIPAVASDTHRVREGTVVAPMQGLILKVMVEVGDNVELGQVVAVLEAMKMQNDITATKAGTVSHVYVEVGAVVSPRDPVVHID